MTPEERLNQIEALLNTSAKYITRHDEAIARHDEAIARHDEAITRHDEAIARNEELAARLNTQMLQLVDLFADLSSYMRRSNERIERNQAEIERLWQYLTGQQGNGRADQNE